MIEKIIDERDYHPDQRPAGVYWWYDRENGAPTVKLNPKTGDFHLGGQGQRGRLLIQTADDCTTIAIDGETGTVEIRDRSGQPRIRLDAQTGDIYLSGEIQKLP